MSFSSQWVGNSKMGKEENISTWNILSTMLPRSLNGENFTFTNFVILDLG